MDNDYSIGIVKSITRDDKNYQATIVIEDITDLSDYKGYIELIVMLINDLGALETYYHSDTNSINVWYD